MKEKKIFPWPTVSGYTYHTVVSALQKTIRKGLETEALFWSTELFLSDYASHAWRRLLTIAVEDISLDEKEVFGSVKELHETWKERKKEADAKLFFIRAVFILVDAKKSRIVDNANIVYFEGTRPKNKIPDYALDIHTTEGRKMGRGQKHFFEEGAKLNNCDSRPDFYEELAKNIRIRNEKKETKS